MRDIETTDLQQLLELRFFLAGFCARLAARRITETQIEKMEQLLQGSGDGYSNYEALLSIDRAFRGLLYEAADNAYLVDKLKSLCQLSPRCRLLVHERLESRQGTIERLSRLLEALRQRDETEAETLMQEHIRVSQQKVGPVM